MKLCINMYFCLLCMRICIDLCTPDIVYQIFKTCFISEA